MCVILRMNHGAGGCVRRDECHCMSACAWHVLYIQYVLYVLYVCVGMLAACAHKVAFVRGSEAL